MLEIGRAGFWRAGWWQAGPRGKSPSRPLAVVGDSISLPRFLHRPQQYHPVHCQPELRNSHVQTDGPAVEQVECRVQLQHCSTSSRTRLLVGRLTIEPVLNPSVGVSSFRFCPPDGPAAVNYLDTPPSIARPSLL